MGCDFNTAFNETEANDRLSIEGIVYIDAATFCAHMDPLAITDFPWIQRIQVTLGPIASTIRTQPIVGLVVILFA